MGGSFGAEGLEAGAKKLRLEALGDDLENEVLSLRWKLPQAEIRAVRESFEFIDQDGSGEVERGELNRLLGFLGCAPTTGIQKAALAKCLEEAKHKGDLDFVGVVGIVCSYQATVIKNIFEASQNSDGHVPISSLVQVFHQAGQYLSKDQIHSLFQECNIDPNQMSEVTEDMLTKVIKLQNDKRSRQWQTNWGFATQEVEIFRDKCLKYGLSEDNVIDISNVPAALKDICPGKKGGEQFFGDTLMKTLMRTDRDDKGMLTFPEVLLLVRHMHNRRNSEDSKVGKALGMDPEAVDQFREAFGTADKDKSGSVTLKEIKLLLSELGVCQSRQQRDLLTSTAEDILNDGNEIGDDSEEEVTFAEFLRILDRFEKNGA